MANPVFSDNRWLKAQPNLPMSPQGSTQTQGFPPAASPVGFDPTPQVMTYEGVVTKASIMFMGAVAAALIVGFLVPGATFIVAGAAFILSLVVAFSRNSSPVLLGITTTLYGGAAGGLSAFYNYIAPGVIMQALIATASVFAASLIVYRRGMVRNIAKVRRFIMIAMPALVIFSLVNLGIVFFGGDNIRFENIAGTSIPWGVPLGLLGILVGAFMLISDFDSIDQGVRQGVSAKLEWVAAYGLVFSIIWIYIEFVRLLAILRGGD